MYSISPLGKTNHSHWHIESNTPHHLLYFSKKTKLPIHKSTQYIGVQCSNYKIIYNNTNDPVTCILRPYVPYWPTRGRLLTMIHHALSCSGNISKISTPITLSPYLQLRHIKNHPFNPLSSFTYICPPTMTTLPSSLTTNNTLYIVLYPMHTLLMVANYNKDIFLTNILIWWNYVFYKLWKSGGITLYIPILFTLI